MTFYLKNSWIFSIWTIHRVPIVTKGIVIQCFSAPRAVSIIYRVRQKLYVWFAWFKKKKTKEEVRRQNWTFIYIRKLTRGEKTTKLCWMFELVPICIHTLTATSRNSPTCPPEDVFLFTEEIKFFFNTCHQLWDGLRVFFWQ